MKFWISMVLVAAADQLSKWWVINNFNPGESIVLINGFLNLTYVQNGGAAFGIMQGKAVVFMVLSIAIIAGLCFYNIRYPVSDFNQLIIGIIAGGALGNLIDRWRYNYVVDFFDLGWWPVFNIADMAIVCGGILFALYVGTMSEVNNE